MSIVTVSPGVFTQENDLSFVPAGIAAIGAAGVGLTQKGPAFQPIKVTGFNDFRSRFGNLDPKLYLPYAAKNYLQNSDQMTIVRVLSTQTSQDVGCPIVLAWPTSGSTSATQTTLSSNMTALGQLRARLGTTVLSATVTGTSNNFSITINSVTAGPFSMNRADSTYIGKALGTDPFAPAAGDQLQSVYVEAIYDYAYYAASSITANMVGTTLTSGNTITPAYSTGIGGYTGGQTPVVVSQNYNGMVYPLFYLNALSDGDASNFDVKVSIAMDTSQVAVSAFPTFTVSVRSFTDTDPRPVVLETFTCNLDPMSDAFIARVIGNRMQTFNTLVDPPELVYTGEFENNSKYINVWYYSGYPQDAKPSGFQAFPAMALPGAGGVGPQFTTPLKKDSLNFAGAPDTKIYMGFDSTALNAQNRLGFLTTGISATSNSAITKGFLIATLTGEASSNTATLSNTYTLVDCSTGTSSTVTAGTSYNAIKFTIPMYGGWNGYDKRADPIEVMANGTLSGDFFNAVKVLGNPDEIDFNLLAIPGMMAGGPANQGAIPAKALDMVTSRGDAFYIMDIGDGTFSTSTGPTGGSITSAIMNSTVNGVVSTAQGFDSNYAAVYFPSVRILDTDNNKYVWVPDSAVVLGAYAFNDKVGQPWFAPAGLNRGVLNVFEARKRLTQTYRDTLYLGKVNPIATFSGQGIVIWGQKTLQFRASALDRVNVRRLLLYARKLIASTAKYFVFEPNNGLTRSNLVNAINPILERIQKNQGIEQFKVVIDTSNNTPDVIDRNQLVGDIYIQPTRTAEIFIFNFNITRTGVAFGD